MQQLLNTDCELVFTVIMSLAIRIWAVSSNLALLVGLTPRKEPDLANKDIQDHLV